MCGMCDAIDELDEACSWPTDDNVELFFTAIHKMYTIQRSYDLEPDCPIGHTVIDLNGMVDVMDKLGKETEILRD